MLPSKYQLAVLDWVENGFGSSIVKAVAGSGKTSLLLMMLQKMIGSVALLAFNNKIKKEIETKVAKLYLPNVSVYTLHALGLKAIKKVRGSRLKVDGEKLNYILDDIIADDEEVKYVRSFVSRLVSLAKDSAFGVEGCPSIDDKDAWAELAAHHDLQVEECEIDFNEAIEICIHVLKLSNEDKFMIDFADMIYHVLLFDLPTDQFDWVLVDEAQDTNVSRRLFSKKIKKENGRLVAVGDDAQAIYGFTGSDAESLNSIQKEFDCQKFPLSICYRCGKNIIAEAQKIVPTIEAFEKNEDGEVLTTTFVDFITKANENNMKGSVGVICRNNAPLIPLAFSLIRKGISCRIEGKDIGNQLAQFTFKWKVKNIVTFQEKFLAFMEKEISKAQEKNQSQKVGLLTDKQDTMLALIDRCISLGQDTLESLRSLIYSMFTDSDGKVRNDILILSSVHKSKGLEWDEVYLIGRSQFMPSKYATQEWMQEQERNLEYVAITRAKNKLVYVEEVPTASEMRAISAGKQTEQETAA